MSYPGHDKLCESVASQVSSRHKPASRALKALEFHPRFSLGALIIYYLFNFVAFLCTAFVFWFFFRQELSCCCVSAACAQESRDGRKAAKAGFLWWISGRPGAAYTSLAHARTHTCMVHARKAANAGWEGVQVEAESSDGRVLIGCPTFCPHSGICERNGNQFFTGQTYKDNCNLWYNRPPVFLFLHPFKENFRLRQNKERTVPAFASRAWGDLASLTFPTFLPVIRPTADNTSTNKPK